MWTVLKRQSLTPWFALGAMLALTISAAGLVAIAGSVRDHARFENAEQGASDRIRARLDTYLAMLLGARGLFVASDTVTGIDFRHYVATIDPQRRFPGIQGIGYTARLTPAERDRLEKAGRFADGTPFHLFPDSPRDEYHSVLYLEPLDARNRVALGYDMFTDPVRREAMERARDTGLPAMSGRVSLVQEIDPQKQGGFLLYVPVYHGDSVPATLEERRQRLAGFVYSPFRTGDLLGGIFGSERRPRVAFEVYDQGPVSPAGLLSAYRVDEQRGFLRPLSDTAHMTVAGRQWTLIYTQASTEDRGGWWILAATIIVAGTVAAIALFSSTRQMIGAQMRAEQSERARARFYAAMSHELRTPLNAIVGYNDLLLAGLYGELSGTQRTALERSQRASRHLTELVNDALDLSKVEAGKVTLENEPVAVPALIDDLLHTIRPLAEARGCEVRWAQDRGATRIVSDPRRVRQILLNLLSNATKFGRGHPIDVRYIEAAAGPTIEVTDHGPGIAADDLPRIFDEFVQLPNTGEGGTGLGLAISRRLAHTLGGRIDVQSEVGHGSTFRLVLPPAPPDVHATRIDPTAMAPL
jgi:signal transduction histidine kinase